MMLLVFAVVLDTRFVSDISVILVLSLVVSLKFTSAPCCSGASSTSCGNLHHSVSSLKEMMSIALLVLG